MVSVTVQELENIGRQRVQASLFFWLAGFPLGFAANTLASAVGASSYDGQFVPTMIGSVLLTALFSGLGLWDVASRRRALKDLLRHDTESDATTA